MTMQPAVTLRDVLEIRSSCSLPVGLVRWADPEPLVTVVVKATYRLAADTPLGLAAEQDPLAVARVVDGVVVASTDFVPRKGAVDVVVVGDACAVEPRHSIPIRITGPGIDKRGLARSAVASSRIPLESRAAFGSWGPQPWLGRDSVPGDRALLTAAGPPLAPLPRSFDYAVFNAAPVDQRIPQLPVAAAFWLEGLVPNRERAMLRLGLVEPVLHWVREGMPVGRAPLRCDTISMDLRRGLVVATFRADLRPTHAITGALLTVGLREEPVSFSALAYMFDRARTVSAVEVSDAALEESQVVSRRRSGTLEVHVARSAWECPGPPSSITSVMVRALPQRPVEADPPSAGDRSMHETIDEHSPWLRHAPLPFRWDPEETPPPSRHRGEDPLAGLPFERPRGQAQERSSQAPPSEPPVGGGDAPLPIAIYAAICAELWQSREPVEAVARRHGLSLTAEAWVEHERRYAELLEAEAKEGRCARALELGRALRAARQQSSGAGTGVALWPR